MRLTLRTLLAYMDDILEPADHEDLGNKIEASDFATELIHRSRDTVRRLRLGAPAVMSDESDDVLDTVDLGDANAVAEYLDNTLPPEQVADFERMCLEPGTEPDMHLAEVASCHHVLTMVLGEPAEVDSDLKSRMYQLPARLASGQKLRIEPAHVAPQAAPPMPVTSPAAPPLAQPASIVAEHELPDYLREAAASKRRSRRWAIGATLLAIGAVVTRFANPPEAMPPTDLTKVDIGELEGGELKIEGLADSSSAVTAGGEGTVTEAPAFVPGNVPAAAAPAFVPAEPSASPEVAPFVNSDPPAIDPGEMKEPTAGIVEVDAPAEVELSGVEPVMDVAADLVDTEPAPGASVPSTTPTPSDDGKAMSDVGAEEPVLVASAADRPMVEVTPEATEPEEPAFVEPAVPQRLGNYLGNNDVLLIHDARRNLWVRMPPRTPISTGVALLTLPKFRTHVVLADVNAYLSGGTRLRIPLERFDLSASDAELNLEMVYGRLLLNAGLKGSQIAMQVDDQFRGFRLASSASLAVEVERVFVPGSDYENESAPIKATWYLTSGSVEWPTATGGTQTIQAPKMWKMIDGIDELPDLLEKLPVWIDRELMTNMQRSAREDLAKELEAGEPVGIRLLELTKGQGLGRRKEVRMLAAASSVYVGEIEPLVMALNDSEQSRDWESLVHSLQQVMALSPDDATRVRQAFVNVRGEEAAHDLMEMIVGYNDEQIGQTREAVQTGALSRLIKWLDHDSLDYRVLAIHNIGEITSRKNKGSGKTKGYRPDAPSKRRKGPLRKIWGAFESHELLP